MTWRALSISPYPRPRGRQGGDQLLHHLVPHRIERGVAAPQQRHCWYGLADVVPDCLLIVDRCIRTHSPHPVVSSPDCLLIAYRCTRTHSPASRCAVADISRHVIGFQLTQETRVKKRRMT